MVSSRYVVSAAAKFRAVLGQSWLATGLELFVLTNPVFATVFMANFGTAMDFCPTPAYSLVGTYPCIGRRSGATDHLAK